MNKRNYQKELEAQIKSNEASGVFPKLLLHACCAPCSSWCLEYLSPHFDITLFYYNPNIDDEEEYHRRAEEARRLIREMPAPRPVHFLEGPYDPDSWHRLVKGHEADPEGGERCFICYEMRLREAASTAKREGFDYFTTTLTLSPLKNAAKLNEIGQKVASEYDVKFLPSDFKKKDGYKRSIQLSNDYDLYRQNYCGCIFSKR